MSKKMFRQCTLTSRTEHDEIVYRVCWLPSSGLKKGMLVTLKEESDGVIWIVAGCTSIEMSKDLLHTDWKCGENGEIAKAPKSNFEKSD